MLALVLSMGAGSARAVPAPMDGLAFYPDVSATSIVFNCADRLWLVPRAGGLARPLDQAPGGSHAKFSPDGSAIAFDVSSGLETQVDLMPLDATVATRMTHHPAGSHVIDWAADGRSIIVASPMLSERSIYSRLFRVARAGGLAQPLPFPIAEDVAYAPDGRRAVYTIYKDYQDEVWKRYRGGRAPKLWLYDAADGSTRRLLDGEYGDSRPMWVGGQIYYLSDKGPEHRTNLWIVDPDSGRTHQLTHFADYDLKYPSVGPKDIVFTVAGQLHLLDLRTQAVRAVPVSLPPPPTSERVETIDVADQISGFELSTKGERVALEAHGAIFVYDIDRRRVLERTARAGVAQRFPSLAPDGRSLAYVSDEGGEYQIRLRDLVSHEDRALTRFASGFVFKPQWSLDGTRLAFLNSRQELQVLDVRSGELRAVMRTVQSRHDDQWDDGKDFSVAWSADGRWLAFSSGQTNRNSALFLYDVSNAKLSRLTSGFLSDYAPVFDPLGRYLYCLSNRRFASTTSDVDNTWAYADSAVVAAIPLRADVPSLRQVRAAADAMPAGTGADTRAPVRIDVAGFEERLEVLGTAAGRLSSLRATAGRLLYLARNAGGAAHNEPVLRSWDLVSGQEDTLWRDANAYRLSSDGSRLLVRKGQEWSVLDLWAGLPQARASEVVFDALRLEVDHAREYHQMLRDAWRFQRDFFYDSALHGLDWQAEWGRYEALLPRVRTVSDMSFLLRELCAELGAGHVVATADRHARGAGAYQPMDNPERIGLLGADLELVDGAYRIQRILMPGLRSAEVRSPLSEPGVSVHAGEYLLSVDGQPLSPQQDPYAAFEGLAERRIELRVGPTPDAKGSRVVQVWTLSDEQKLRELDWVERNRQTVDRLSGGRVGYIYVPDITTNGRDDLMRQFLAQHDKPALLIDERFNRGGELGDRFVELLNRPALVYFSTRNLPDYALPLLADGGPKALLTNGWSYSGGDGFPLLFRNAGLGPLIGTRTRGGLIGPNLNLPLVNGGFISAPPQRVYDPNGRWSDAKQGVVPDIAVETDPGELMQGRDTQLERGVSVLMQALRKAGPPVKSPLAQESSKS